MKVKTDDIGRIHLIDNSEPYGSIVFDIYSDDQVVFYQDSNDQDIRTAFENIDEGVELDRYELIDGLKQVIQKLEEI